MWLLSTVMVRQSDGGGKKKKKEKKNRCQKLPGTASSLCDAHKTAPNVDLPRKSQARRKRIAEPMKNLHRVGVVTSHLGISWHDRLPSWGCALSEFRQVSTSPPASPIRWVAPTFPGGPKLSQLSHKQRSRFGGPCKNQIFPEMQNGSGRGNRSNMRAGPCRNKFEYQNRIRVSASLHPS